MWRRPAVAPKPSAITALMSTSLMALGFGGLVSFGHAAFFGIEGVAGEDAGGIAADAEEGGVAVGPVALFSSLAIAPVILLCRPPRGPV